MATVQSTAIDQMPQPPAQIAAPASTMWPLVLAFGLTLIFAGLLTSVSVGVLGAALTLASSVGWFREVLPRGHEVEVPVIPDGSVAVTNRPVVDRLPVAPDQLRAWLPLFTHPISAGLRGGLAGGVAMALLACAYGVLRAGSIWYPINLLAASIYAQSVKFGATELTAFHWDSFAIALGLHALVSTSVGLLYGAMLPMFANRPVLLGGLVGPALWSGLLYSMLSLLNPTLENHIDWLWFVASQVAFGVVAGLVVLRRPQVPTGENVSFAIRAGVEASGITRPSASGEERQ
jgi:hypothetical protein